MIQVEGRDNSNYDIEVEEEEEEEDSIDTNSVLRFTGAGIVAWILVISDFMIKVEGRDNSNYDIEVEEEEEDSIDTNSVLRFTGAGIVAWILGSSNHQFFITLAPTPWLDSTTTTTTTTTSKENRIFGRIKSGLGVIKRIGLVKTDPQTNKPVEDVRILKTIVVKKD
ncbi:hypothetical protein MP638_000921 [Amoeboaphelidium occidentale]|nr:hypothetical protein MP638_000921 [Amoeboaphelidium occidentale]